MTNQISREDVMHIAYKLALPLTEKQIDWVLENFDSSSEQDPGATWDLIVEQMLYDIPGEIYNFYVDQKVTTWMRTEFRVKAESGEESIQTATLLHQEGEIDSLPWEKVYDTDEPMSLEDNDGFSTIEMYNPEGKIVYQNGTEEGSPLKGEIISILETLKKDAEMALSGEWDCTTQEGIETGFNGQITLIENILDKLKSI
jgi:hypothetical protein